MKEEFNFEDFPMNEVEVLAHKLNGMIALRVDPLNGAPVFAIQKVNTVVATSHDSAEFWAHQQIKDGAQIVFILKKGKWVLQEKNPQFNFSKKQIETFFLPDSLSELWRSHHPVSSTRDDYFNALRGKRTH